MSQILAHIYIYIFIFMCSYFKHIFTGYKFNKYIVLQFGPVKIKVPNKLLQISEIKIYTTDDNKLLKN